MRCMSPRVVQLRSCGLKQVDDISTMSPASTKGKCMVPCGTCINCRIDQSRVWRNRLLLENACHGNSCFVTLTYADKYLPDPPHVKKKDFQDFIKKIRRNIEPNKIRYFGVGEYGDTTFRPHYHVVLFGLDGILSRSTIKRCWPKCDPVIGLDIGELNQSSASYITGYITKKTLKDKNKHPVNYGKEDEFMLCSKRPGIGAQAVDKIYKTIKDKEIEKKEFALVRINGKKVPLGRYLKQRLDGHLDINIQQKMLDFFKNQQLYFDKRMKDIRSETYTKRVII